MVGAPRHGTPTLSRLAREILPGSRGRCITIEKSYGNGIEKKLLMELIAGGSPAARIPSGMDSSAAGTFSECLTICAERTVVEGEFAESRSGTM